MQTRGPLVWSMAGAANSSVNSLPVDIVEMEVPADSLKQSAGDIVRLSSRKVALVLVQLEIQTWDSVTQ